MVLFLLFFCLLDSLFDHFQFFVCFFRNHGDEINRFDLFLNGLTTNMTQKVPFKHDIFQIIEHIPELLVFADIFLELPQIVSMLVAQTVELAAIYLQKPFF